MITEGSIAPASNASGWSSTAPNYFIFSGEGQRTICAWAKDMAGNVSSCTIHIITITLPDLANPSVAITSPAADSIAKGMVSIAVTAIDNGPIAKVQLYVNGTLHSTDRSYPYLFEWDSGANLNGTYLLSAKAYDLQGNAGTSSVSIIVNRIPMPPTNLFAK